MNPKVIALGDLTEHQSLLIFGGCYSNLAATKALQEWAIRNGYGPDQCICTGDIVAYCAEPLETTKLIKDWNVACIQGNVEQSLANNIDQCGCGFESGTTCDVLSKGWFSYANAMVQNQDRQWFAQLPEHICFSFADKQCLVVHGAISDVSKFMFASHPEKQFFEEFDRSPGNDIVIAGHSGLPFTRRFDDKIWHNSGALGMPANDGTQRVWFSTLEIDASQQIVFKHHALDYDVQTTSALMKSNGLDQGYHTSLKSGLWPSMDVLPEKEKRQQGIALSLSN